jgi:hypothetical protein
VLRLKISSINIFGNKGINIDEIAFEMSAPVAERTGARMV